MTAPTIRQQLEHLYRIGRKWRWFGLVPGTVVLVLGVAAALLVPTQYTASSTVSVDSDSPSNPLLRELNVDQRQQHRLAVVAETIHSWDVLEQTVTTVGAEAVQADSARFLSYLKGAVSDWLVRPRTTSLPAAVATLDAATDVKQWGRDLIRISYTGLDPHVAAEITNALVAGFLDETSMSRRRSAQATVAFISEQLAMYEQRLRASEEQMRAFREDHLDASPNQFNVYVGTLATAQADVVATQISLREVEQRIAFLREQLGETEESIVSERIRGTNPVVQEMQAQLVDAQVELASLRTNYTDKHPRIVQLLGRIEDLQKAIEDGAQVAVTSETSTMNPAYTNLVQTLQDARIEQDSLKLRLTAQQDRIATLEASIQSIPEQEQEFVQLTRDSKVNERIYELLLQKLEEARISQRLAEEERSAENFRVIDSARAPLSPSGPNRLLLLTLAVGAALGSGLGGVLARHQMDESYDDAASLASAQGYPCLAVIPRLDKIA